METAMPEPHKPEPIIRLSWPKDAKGGGISISGHEGLALGQKVEVTLVGEVTGYSMQDYGCDISIKGKKVRVEKRGSMGEDVESRRARPKKKEDY